MNGQNKILLSMLFNISIMLLLNSCSVKSETIIKQQESEFVVGFISAITQKSEIKSVESR